MTHLVAGRHRSVMACPTRPSMLFGVTRLHAAIATSTGRITRSLLFTTASSHVKIFSVNSAQNHAPGRIIVEITGYPEVTPREFVTSGLPTSPESSDTRRYVSVTAKSRLSNARVPGLNCPVTARRRVDADRKSKHANIPRDMIASGSSSQYVLGSTDAEQERLIRQAARLDPYTERLFRDAGMSPGQRILDIGSGVGDVAMLAARLVGPAGEIVGVERDERSIARARARVAEA